MKLFVQKIGALVLATLILVATTSVSVRMHYCGTHLVSISLNKAPKKCCSLVSLNKKTFLKNSKKSCCHDTEFIKTAEENLNKSEALSFSIEKSVLLSPIYFLESALEVSLQVSLHNFSTYRPPIINIDRQVSYQVFLI